MVGYRGPVEGRIFHTHQDRHINSPSPLNKGHRVSSPCVKWSGHGVTLPPTSTSWGWRKSRAITLLPFWPSWPVLSWTLLSPYLACCITVRFSLTRIVLPAVTKDVRTQNCKPIGQSEATAICSLLLTWHISAHLSATLWAATTPLDQVQRLCGVLRKCAHMNVTRDVGKAHVGSQLGSAEEARQWSASNWSGPTQPTSTRTASSFKHGTARDAHKQTYFVSTVINTWTA